MNQSLKDWQRENHKAILQRLGWLHNKPDGIVIHHETDDEELIIVKKADFIFLHFIGKDEKSGKDCISDVMSLINISQPLTLYSHYTQAMLMVLAFVPQPRRLYMLGFGGGRIPMVLHHYLPELQIEASEISAGVIALLEMCFGIKTCKRMNVEKADGKQHLQSFPLNHFDIILLDSFAGAGDHPDELSTLEFYQLCKSRLSTGGVIATNLVDNNSRFKQKAETFCAAFKYVYHFSYEENHIYLGADKYNINNNQLVSMAKQVDSTCQFNFKLSKYAARFQHQYCDNQNNLLTDNLLTT